MKHISTFLLLLILIASQFLFTQPFFHQGFFPTHDAFQTVRTFEYYQSLMYGEFPPRWSSGLLYGYGYPLFVFYGPFVYFLGSIFVILGFNFLVATKIIFVLSFFIGVTGIFFLVNHLSGKPAALVSSLVYSLVPYRAVDVYVRGNLAEFFAYSLFPWLFFINIKFLNSKKSLILFILFSLTLTILLLSHNLSTFIFAIFLFVFNLFYVLRYQFKERSRLFKYLSLSTILTLILSCFYWLPVLIESHFVQLDKFTAYPYKQYFLSFQQLWQSKWGYGLIGKDAMSLQLGQVIIIIVALTIILNVIIKTRLRSFIFFICGSFIISTLLETRITEFLWDKITLLHYLQFPWRFHIISTTSGVILVGFFFYLLQSTKIYQHRIGKIIFSLIIIIVILSSFRESYFFFKTKSFLDKAEVSETTTNDDEYMPKWVKTKPNHYAAEKIILSSETAILANINWGYHQKSFTVSDSKQIRVQIAQIYYPGWEAYVNNGEVEINYNNNYGAMEIMLPAGKNEVLFTFRRTWWRWVADITSIAGVLIVTYLIYVSISRRKNLAGSDK